MLGDQYGSFLPTRGEVDLLFKRTGKVFNRLNNWCIAINAGTLLWFAENFSRFIVKAADGVSEYIPNREIYICFISVSWFCSSYQFDFYFYAQLLVWTRFYDMRLRDLRDMDDRRVPGEPNSQFPLSPIEKEFMDIVSEKHRKDWADGVRNE
jgi:hypothetical protein